MDTAPSSRATEQPSAPAFAPTGLRLGRDPEGPPRAARYTRRCPKVLFAIGLTLLMSSLYFTAPSRAVGRWGFPAVLTCVSLGAGLLILAVACETRARNHLRRALRNADGRLCTQCGHDLRGLGDCLPCPECGVEFQADRDRWRWQKFIKYPS